MTTAIILAAGTGARFGGQKLLALLDGKPLIAHVIAAVAHLPTVVVAGPDLRATLEAHPNVRFVENREPERGMAHSLRLADAAIDRDDTILVLLADMPFVTRELVDRVLASGAGHDVAYPVRNGVGGHPVFFSASARAGIDALPDGDTLKALRDAPGNTVARLETEDPGAYRDIDTPEQAAKAGATITQ